MAFSPDNSKIVSGCDKTIKIWNALFGQLVNTLIGHHDSVSSVTFSPDNSKIVSGQLINTLNGHHNSVLSVAFSY